MLESILLVLSISIDSFVASIAYGTSKIKIPVLSAFIISIVSTITLSISIFLGAAVKDFIPISYSQILGSTLLISLGIYRIFEFIFKSYISKKQKSKKPLEFKLFDFNFVLQIYADETKADFDKSFYLSPKEAFYLAFAMSLDSLSVGFSSSLCSINYFDVITLSLIFCFILIVVGFNLGLAFSKKIHLELSWLSGVLLIILALIRLF